MGYYNRQNALLSYRYTYGYFNSAHSTVENIACWADYCATPSINVNVKAASKRVDYEYLTFSHYQGTQTNGWTVDS